MKFSACLFLFVLQNYLTLLDDEDHTLEGLKIQDEQQLVIEGMKDRLSPFQQDQPCKNIKRSEKMGVYFLYVNSYSGHTVRNKDMSWPEEMSFIANSSKMDRHKGEPGDSITTGESVLLAHFPASELLPLCLSSQFQQRKVPLASVTLVTPAS